MQKASNLAAQLHRASMVSPFFYVLASQEKNGEPVIIGKNQKRTFGFTTPAGKTLRLTRLQYVTWFYTDTLFPTRHYFLGVWRGRNLPFSFKRYLNIKIIDSNKTPLIEDNVQSQLETITKVSCNNGALINSEVEPGHLRLKRIFPPLSQFSVEVTNNSDYDLAFSGLVVALGVDK